MKDQEKTKEQLVKELAECRQRLAELEASEAERKRAEEELAGERNLLRTLIDNMPDAIYVKDAQSRFVVANQGIAEVMGTGTPEGLLGKTDFDFYPQALATKFYADERRIIESGQPLIDLVEPVLNSGGRQRWFSTTKVPLRDSAGSVIGLVGIGRDITEHKQAEEAQHAKEILEISTPVLQVWEGVVVAPLIGTLDSQRTQRFMEVLLERIVETQSAIVLVDITGVPTIDTQTAQHLIETISAVRLLGARVVLTGVRPAIAQTLVHLGIDLSGITTRSSLVAGLRVALELLHLRMISKDGD
jgi:rsbT co-antagonist protein RsbR